MGRFSTQDRFAEKYYPMAVYQYGANNPILNIDVNGDSVSIHFNRGTQTLHLIDHDHYQEGLPISYVLAADYQQGGRSYNQGKTRSSGHEPILTVRGLRQDDY